MFGAMQASAGPGQITRKGPIRCRVAPLPQGSAQARNPNHNAERKKPRSRARGFRSCCVLAGLEPGENRAGELIVQAGANDVLGEADVVDRRSDGGVEAAEIDVE